MSNAPTPGAAGVPSGNGKYIAIAVLLLGAVVGAVIWKLTRPPPEPPPPLVVDAGPAPSLTYTGRNPEDDVPLPPPIVDAGPTKPTTNNTGGGGGSYQCDVRKCSGGTTSELEGQLAARTRQAHRCYDNALAQDPTLRGKITVAVRVGTNGTVCPNVSIVSNEMGSQSVASCVAGAFRNVSLSSPKGGCADVNIPINFVPRQ